MDTVSSEFINNNTELSFSELKARLKQGDREIARLAMLGGAMAVVGLIGILGGSISLGIIAAGAAHPSLTAGLCVLGSYAVPIVGIPCGAYLANRFSANLLKKGDEWEETRKKLERQLKRLTEISSVPTQVSVIELTNLKEKHVAQIA